MKYVITVKDDGSAVLNKFGKNAENADSKMSKLSSGLGVVAKGATVAAGAFAGAGVAMFAMIKSVNDNIDKQGKFAQKIGFSIEALSEYQHAAQLSGMSSDQLNKSMLKLTEGLDNARSGSGEAMKSLQILESVIGKDLINSGMSAEQLMPLLADGFSKMTDAGQKTAIAMDLFGKEGSTMVNMLSSGSSGLSAMREEARKLGATITGDAAGSAANFNDELLRLQQAWESIVRVFVVEATPKITEMMQGLKEEFLNNKDAYVDFFLDLFKFITSAIGSFQQMKLRVEIAFKSVLIALVASIEGIMAGIMEMINATIEGINILLPKSKELSKIQYEAFSWTKDLAGDIKKASDELVTLNQRQMETANTFKKSAAPVVSAVKSTPVRISAPGKDKEASNEEAKKRAEDLKTMNDEILSEWEAFYKRRDEIKAEVAEREKGELQARLDQLKMEFDEKAFYLEETAELEKQYAEDVARTKKEFAEEERARKKAEFETQMQAIAMTVTAFTTMGRMIAGSSKKYAKERKALAMTEAGVSQGLAIMKAWGSAPFPANMPAVLMTTAQTLAILNDMKSRRFQAGGIIQGHNQMFSTNENGRPEAIVNANATAMLGKSGVDALNQGRTQDLLNIIAENTGGAIMGKSVVINITGGMVDKRFVEDTLVPAISKARSRS